MLQIEERQKLFTTSDQPLPSNPQTTTSEPSSAPIAEASPSGRPSSLPTASKRTARSGRGGAQPFAPPETSRPAGYPEDPTVEVESKREFHSDHSREGTGGSAAQAVMPEQQAQTDAAAPSSEDKPPPLAGPNVMNIVVVAAECAPWSKTGEDLFGRFSALLHLLHLLHCC